ncbi:MAG: multiheme c-type cytochrome [Colwellia sp.]|nr:multiheme c-type cytochrome [Colwellia sp.]MCW8865651.1 multiheme c-type cytochrome [Colwellia sp.]MCW9083190.1 multiheme c-type cytochrome [Colwellia sp.]
MRWIYSILLPSILVLLAAGIVYKHKNKATIIKVPPTELAQWYKPDNKRQVWLHNMFKLRREMQAVLFYAEQKDNEHIAKWAQQLNEHYLKIGEMIPSWNKKLDKSALSSIQTNVANQDYPNVIAAVNTLQKSCDSCHDDYQAITALTYRAPDFSSIEITPSLSFNSHMQALSKNVNQIKIASEDGMPDLALSSLTELNNGMNELGETCVNCHKKDRKTYPSEQMNNTLLSLEQNLKTGSLKAQGRDLGTLAVLACARCHGTHRLAFGAKSLLSKEPNLAELLKH